jgi:hypothetical protein
VSERRRDKLALFWKYLPSCLERAFVPGERDYALVRLPKFLAFGYYIIHPIRLAGSLWNKALGSTDRVEK